MPAYKDTKRGTWFVKYSVTVDGKRKQVLKRGFETKRDALMYEHAAKLTPVASGVTFAELTQNYLNYKSPKQSTRDLYERLLAVHFPFMDQKAAAISKAALMNWYLALPAELSASTKNTLLVIVKAVFRYGHDFYELPNPAHHLRRFKKSTKEMETWAPDEFARFLAAVDNDLYKAFFSFLYWTGCRKGEAQALRYDDFKGNTVHIHQQWNGTGFTDLKTESSERTLLLPDALQGVLRPLLARCTESEPFVFGGIEPISKTALRYWWERSIKVAGVKPIRMHDLRHSFATNMINSGANIVAVSKYLGHANINITLQVYTHLLEKTNAEMVTMINDLMKNGIKSVSQPVQMQ